MDSGKGILEKYPAKDMYSKMYLDKANIQQSKWCVKTAGKKIVML